MVLSVCGSRTLSLSKLTSSNRSSDASGNESAASQTARKKIAALASCSSSHSRMRARSGPSALARWQPSLCSVGRAPEKPAQESRRAKNPERTGRRIACYRSIRFYRVPSPHKWPRALLRGAHRDISFLSEPRSVRSIQPRPDRPCNSTSRRRLCTTNRIRQSPAPCSRRQRRLTVPSVSGSTPSATPFESAGRRALTGAAGSKRVSQNGSYPPKPTKKNSTPTSNAICWALFMSASA